jgi:tetratricopeptide (TPR) repeat protein
MLDGVLTANIQPEGLQVGDVLNFAVSVSSSDPVLRGHVEQMAGGWNGMPVGRAHLRMQWPSSLPLRLRQTQSLPPLRPKKENGTNSVELLVDDLQPLNPPKGAPARFNISRLVEATDFASWSDLAALEAPLYEKAARLPSEGTLRAEVARIKALSPDPLLRAEAALALVQDRIRYVALFMGEGALVPADAQSTWSRRFGDCKGKTALLLGLLHELGIEAEPVAVSIEAGDGLNERLPMVGLFDHVLVRAKVGGRSYWLDGTRTGDKKLANIQVPAFGWGLPLVAGADLVKILPPPLERPNVSSTIRMDARAGLNVPAPTRIETVMRGDEAIALNMSLSNLIGDARERSLREYWKEQHDFIDVKSVSATFDAASAELRLAMEGEARMDWSSGGYWTDGTGLGYKADFSREPGAGADAPFAVPYPFYARNVQTILLPKGFTGFKSGSNAQVNETIAGVEYRRQATLEDNVFTVEASQRSIAPEFPAKDAPAAQKALRALVDKAVYIQKPSTYRLSEKEIAADLQATPKDADDFVRRGNLMLDSQRFDEAIDDFSRALRLEPNNAWALANRGISHVWKEDTASAIRDLEAAAKIDPRNPVVFRARGLMAEQKGAAAEAIAAYTRSLDIDPSSGFALHHRALSYRAAGERDKALQDAAAAIKINPRNVDLYLLRANLLAGQPEQALAEAAAVSEANEDSVFAQVAAARIYGHFGRQAEAMRALDRAIAIKPEPFIYVNRSEIRPKEDLAGRNADLDQALRLDPTSSEAVEAKAHLLLESGNYEAAAAKFGEALALSPKEVSMLVHRGIAYAKAGKAALAEKDFSAARAGAIQAVDLNNMCWAKATAGVALESALNDCNGALAKSPRQAGYIDSRALVLLRLGRTDEAIAEYDRALALEPNQSSSLFGRAAAWARKGDKAKSENDADAATKTDPAIRKRFEEYGITL